MKDKDLVIFHRDSVEFVTVAAEFCGFLERAGEQKRRDFVDHGPQASAVALPQGFHVAPVRTVGHG